MNNANHLADEQAQVLVNWSQTTTSSYLHPVTGFDADRYYPITRFGPVPLSMKPDGASYALRGRLRAYLGNAATGDFIVTVAAPGQAERVASAASATNRFMFQTTGTTDAWRDATGSNIASLSVEDMALTVTEMSALAAVGGASIAVLVPLVEVTVFAKSTSAGSEPRLTGLYLAEYIGA